MIRKIYVPCLSYTLYKIKYCTFKAYKYIQRVSYKMISLLISKLSTVKCGLMISDLRAGVSNPGPHPIPAATHPLTVALVTVSVRLRGYGETRRLGSGRETTDKPNTLPAYERPGMRSHATRFTSLCCLTSLCCHGHWPLGQ